MDEYKVIVTDHALSSMTQIRDYIAFELSNPDAAVKHLRLFQKEIRTLSENPGRYQLIDEEPWHSDGIRRLKVRNYCVYYWISKDERTVYVIDVIYAGSDEKKWLEKISQK